MRRTFSAVRFLLASSAALSLGACSGADAILSGSSSGSTTDNPIEFAGFITQGEINTVGDITGIASDETIVVRKGADGYAYATTLVNSADFAETDANAGERAFIATAGLLPSTDLGDPPSSGTASYAGDYEMTYVEIPADNSEPTNDSFERATGTITLDANFDNSTLDIDTVAETGAELTVSDFSSANGDLLLNTRYRGVPGVASGKIGTSRAVGVIAGSNSDALYSGGFIADR